MTAGEASSSSQLSLSAIVCGGAPEAATGLAYEPGFPFSLPSASGPSHLEPAGSRPEHVNSQLQRQTAEAAFMAGLNRARGFYRSVHSLEGLQKTCTYEAVGTFSNQGHCTFPLPCCKPLAHC